MKLFLFGILFIICILNFYGQNTFFHTYGGSGNDYGKSIVCTNDYGYVVIGATEGVGNGATDCYLFKIDSLGNFMWSKTFGGANIDWGTDIVQTTDSNLVFCGYSNSYSSDYDVTLWKTDSSGNLIWEQFYGGSDWDFAYSMAKTADSGFVVAGETYSFGNGQNDGYLIRLNAQGDTLWTKAYGGAQSDVFNDVVVCKNGSILCSGQSNSYSTNGDVDFWVVYMDSSGNTIWDVTLGDSLDDWANGGYEAFDGNLQIIGTKTNPADSVENWWVYELDSTGNVVWEIANYQTSTNNGMSLIGYPYEDSTFLNAMTTAYGNGGYDFYYSKFGLDSWLNLNYTSTFGGAYDDKVSNADTTYDHSFVSVGTTNTTDFGQTNVAVYLLDRNYLIPPGNYSETEDITSISDFSASGISIYPNPANTVVEIITSEKFTMNCYSISGSLVFTRIINGPSRIDFSAYPRGMYLLEFINGTTIFSTQKLILTQITQ